MASFAWSGNEGLPGAERPIVITLGIETSCDETGVALVADDGSVLADVIASQIGEHAPFGGIVPELAARSHLRNLVPTADAAFQQAGLSLTDVSGIAVTQGPGLVGALLIGVQFAKSLALATELPLVGVNHLEAHLLAVYLKRDRQAVAPEMPFIGLLASGGHTSLYHVRTPRLCERLASTRDDAAGEAFDKAAKLLGLPYPGGPEIDRLAEHGDPTAIPLPVPMRGRPGLDFSFSGLKTALATTIRAQRAPLSCAALRDLCASFQRAVVEALLLRAFRACEQTHVPRLVLAGGVAANRGLRAEAVAWGATRGVEVFCPELASCTDNAAMIAFAGMQRLLAGEHDDLQLAAYARDIGFRKGRFR